MQTLTVNIQENFMQDFLSIIEHYKDKIQINIDKNLEYDSYFYERQKELQKIRNDIKENKRKLVSIEDFEKNTLKFENELELKYAN